MLKVLAAVLAVLSAAISITIYTATLPDIQKQAADNAEAIETLGGSVEDNAEAIETLESAIENMPTEKRIFSHGVFINQGNNIYIAVQIYNDNDTQLNGFNAFDTEIRRLYGTSNFHSNGYYKSDDYAGNIMYGGFDYEPGTGTHPIVFFYFNIDTKTRRSFKIDNTFNFNDIVKPIN